MIKYLFTLLFVFVGIVSCLQAQEVFYNNVFVDYIQSVQFHPAGKPLQMPVTTLARPYPLEFKFDDLSNIDRQYMYSIQHCNHDWTASNISELEYLNGFSEEYVDMYEFSVNTRVQYTFFSLTLPNRDMSWKISGNYVLKIFDVTDDKELVITQRFMVVDGQMLVQATMREPTQASLFQTHQQLQFKINTDKHDILNPLQMIKATVMQNGRWDNAIIGLPPRFERSNELIYDYQNKMVFPAIKEFRQLDIRTFRARNNRVESIRREDDGFIITLLPDVDREFASYLFYYDINGRYIIETFDNLDDYSIASDYGLINFVLPAKQPQPDGKRVFVYGHFNDFNPRLSHELFYDEVSQAYVGGFLLKQGFYNYLYGVADKDGKVDFTEFEGNWYQTANEYQILIYYRPFGQRYDSLISFKQFPEPQDPEDQD